MKRLIAFILICCICFLSSTSMAVQTEGYVDNIHWKFEKNAMSFSGDGRITSDGPWNAFIDKITTLEFSGDDLEIYDFLSGKNVKNIIFGKGVKVVDNFAVESKSYKLTINENDIDLDTSRLSGSNISHIIIGEDVNNFVVEDNMLFNKDKNKIIICFEKKKKLIVVPESVKIIGVNAFFGNKANEIRLPDGLLEIRAGAFFNCDNLQSITIPGSVSYIGYGALSQCYKLKSLNYINPYIEKCDQTNYFFRLESIEELVVPAYGSDQRTIVDVSKKLKHIIISDGTTELNISGLFSENGMSNLVGVYFPKSLRKISDENLPYGSSIKMYVIENSYAHKFALKYGLSHKVVIPIEDVKLSKDSLELRVKKADTLKATIFPKNATAKAVQWMSTNENVAIVNDGKVTATGEGECDIYCRGLDSGLVTATCHVTVSK